MNDEYSYVNNRRLLSRSSSEDENRDFRKGKRARGTPKCVEPPHTIAES